MIEADSVHSTPRMTASKTNPPVDQARRRLLTIAAGGAVAAAIPAAALAAGPADPIFAMIAEKRAADIAHEAACDAYSDAEKRYGVGSVEADDAWERGGPACHAAMDAGWPLATTAPTTLAGVVAVLRFANEFENAGLEWPDTDTIGSEGWHYQLRATMAAAVEAIIRRAA
jgi:hypothetical protein